ncbi:cation:proton antiporter domain-containing protein [Nocardia salmonicida]|uniref:cation:proton antiporter domain-containing protein n=1 Tax=Nocardia salmonicida TaxID=53431 RepID=UPI0007A39257|nr:cation:proton antiporter [Nocardia salmonicida]
MDLLASAGAGDPSPIVSLFWIALIAVVAPLLSRLVRGYLPDVVILLVAGAVIGPHVLGWASSAGGVDLVSELGLGMLFLLAGYELDPLMPRGDNLPTGRERVELALYAATGLPIIVAVTQVATQTGLLKADVASILVAAGAMTVLVFPLVARLIGPRRRSRSHPLMNEIA